MRRQLVERFRLPQVEAETLVPAMLVYRELLAVDVRGHGGRARRVAARRRCWSIWRPPPGARASPTSSAQVLASAAALGEKYRYDATHAQHVGALATRLFDELPRRSTVSARAIACCCEVAALLHDIGILRQPARPSQAHPVLLAASQIFGLSRRRHGDRREHRPLPPARRCRRRSHLPYMRARSRAIACVVNKLAAILRRGQRARRRAPAEGAATASRAAASDVGASSSKAPGDLTMERLAATARADMFADVFGRRW